MDFQSVPSLFWIILPCITLFGPWLITCLPPVGTYWADSLVWTVFLIWPLSVLDWFRLLVSLSLPVSVPLVCLWTVSWLLNLCLDYIIALVKPSVLLPDWIAVCVPTLFPLLTSRPVLLCVLLLGSSPHCKPDTQSLI